MTETTRRGFLQQSAAGVAGAAALQLTSRSQAAVAGDRIVFGLIGCGGRGSHLAEQFRMQPNVELAYLADVDQNRLSAAARSSAGQGAKPVHDFREILDDKSVDAVIVATPDHWHAPASILACDAGKHVYVEKPCSHNVREGRLLVEAARRNDRIVQHGTQCRSTKMMLDAVEQLRKGVIGDVFIAKAWNIQERSNIGHGTRSDAPAHLDYDMWVGPATMIPYQENRVHGGWHWWYNFGTGDAGNDGVHDIDYARWGLGVDTHPSLITGAGGKYFFDDDQEFPDTQQTTFEYGVNGKPGERKMLIYEQRLWSMNHPYNVDSGVEFYGTKGLMFLSRRGKVQVRNSKKQIVDLNITSEPQNIESHVSDFLDAIRNHRKPNADVEEGHLSSSLSHLANVATRLGRSLRFDPQTERFLDDDEANQLVGRDYRAGHWAAPRVS
jgi:predicted dehydrogenase